MKSLLLASLTLIQVHAYATSRTPELYCASEAQGVAVKVFNDELEREAEVLLWNGSSFQKKQSGVVSKYVGQHFLTYHSQEFELMVKKVDQGHLGELTLHATAGSVIYLECRL